MATSTLPTAPAPTRQVPSTARSGPAPYWIGGVLIVLGILGAALWVGLGWLALMHHVDGFPRLTVPGSAVVHVASDTKQVLYSEHARGAADITPADLTVTGPDGDSVALGAYPYDLRYDVPGDSARVGRAIASFRSTVAGAYTVTSAGSPQGGAIAIGDDVVWNAVPHVIGAVVLFLVGVGGGTAVIGITRLRRTRASRATT